MRSPCLVGSLSCALAAFSAEGLTQDTPPTLQTGVLTEELVLDGRLDEASWAAAPVISSLTMVEPREGDEPSFPTQVRVLADSRSLVIGVRCDDPDPAGIVSYTMQRDASQRGEDHLRIVLGTFQDGRTGYVFSVNPGGARYDALIANRGEGEDRSWDGTWEAATTRDDQGWGVELRIPITTLTFKEGLRAWHFNLERRIQRLLETDRWAGARLDWRVTQTSHAGLLTYLPEFDLGRGLAVRPALSGRRNWESDGGPVDNSLQPSLDVTWKATSDLTAKLTFNTDFAETEVDTRQTNLTRFPLFFPEKRAFFLEGADYFDFGFGLGRDLVPYHSRRIGLVEGEEVPLLVGGKVFGRTGGTSIGGLVAHTGLEEDVAPATTMGVARVRQDVLAESTMGMIATAGDPEGRPGSWMTGADFTYQTSRLWGDKNFLVGIWGLAMGRDDLEDEYNTALGTKIDYPNDLWDVALTWKRIDEDFDPSIGFVPRTDVNLYTFNVEYMPRPDWSWVRQMFYELKTSYVTDLENNWETYRVFTAPVNWNLESGDSFEFNVVGSGDRPEDPFEVGDGVEIPAGSYHWTRYRVTAESASKRILSGEVAWWFGGFYDGTLDTYEASLEWNPVALLTLGANGEWNEGQLPAGDFTQNLYGSKIRFNFSPDLTFSSFIQYDTESASLGTNNRLRWTMSPGSDLFVVLNYNWSRVDTHWTSESYDTSIKVQYEMWF